MRELAGLERQGRNQHTSVDRHMMEVRRALAELRGQVGNLHRTVDRRMTAPIAPAPPPEPEVAENAPSTA